MLDTQKRIFADAVDFERHGRYAIRAEDGEIYKFRGRISDDGSTAFSAEPGRYHVYLAKGCVSGPPAQRYEPAWTRDGQAIAYVADGVRIEQVPIAGGAPTLLASTEKSSDVFRPTELHGPVFGPDGAVYYHRIKDIAVSLMRDDKPHVEGEDLFPFRPGWLPNGDLVHAGGGRIWRRTAAGVATAIPFQAEVTVATPAYNKKRRDHDDDRTRRPVIGVGSPALSPDGKRIVFRALNDLWVMTIGEQPRRLTHDAFHKAEPSWSPDGRSIAYSTDRKGKLDIWIRDLASGTDRQLKRLIGPLWQPGRPSWGPDGKTIALAAFKPYWARYREGLSQILTLDRETGQTRYTPVAPHRSIATRGDDGPSWSPDGRHFAYIMGSTLWIQPVDPAGGFKGAPLQLNTETSDAPSWSGDSQSLLYLSNGKLRRVGIGGGRPRTIPLPLAWAMAKPRGKTLIRVGRLWDGEANGYRRNADIAIEDNRIVSVGPAGAAPPSDPAIRFIDARDQVAMPGLIDMHTHRQASGYGYGDKQGRLWLSLGITATRSCAGPCYHMVENREARAAGTRIGPRDYATGEAIDGSRIFYNMMRPLTEPGQLALELARADALDYDFIKTYVRLPHDVQRDLVREAHRRGMHITSHYHWPALANAADAMEHLGATNRLGFSRTHSATGAGYDDANLLFGKAKAGRTPTMFFSQVLFIEDRSLVDDPRVAALYPSWELEKLKSRAATVGDVQPQSLQDALRRNVEQIKATIAAGWHILSGTDAPIEYTAVGLHLQLRAMAKYGVPGHEVLRTATSYAGQFLDEPIGRLAPGQLADLLLVRGDPLADVKDAAAVQLAMINGVGHMPQDLIAPFAHASQAAHDHNPTLPALAASGPQPWWHDPDWVEGSRNACCAGHGTHAVAAA